MKGFYKIVFGALFVLMFLPASSTHIVGGVMNYRYLGNDDFEIDLSVYRDCKRGVPPLDFYALIWVWNHDIPDTILTTFYQIPFDSVLDATIKDPCALIQPDECVNWTRYTGTINLPPNNTGYTVYYQRCCRNNSILNITRNPFSLEIEWGATYSVFIPPGVNGTHVQNDNPVYTNYPPVYICEGKPIDYDHSATDADGDQLRYRLCTPVTGASIFDPTNYYTLEPPPFDTITWNSPYSLDNILGGVPLSIDPVSGIMSGTPNTLGQFVVGVCVDEFRNNQLLTTTVRDFQFNVVNCGLQVISSFFAPDLECNSLTVSFDNQSSGADRYYWDFGDGDTSTEVNPVHTYADTGIYRVSLLSVRGDTCTSSYSRQLSIQYKRIEADFEIYDTACLKAGDTLRFIDRSTDSLNVASWQWTFGNGQQSNSQYPFLIYDGVRDTLSVTLLVTSVNGCTSTKTKTIRFLPKPPYTLPNVITKCELQTSAIPLIMNGNHTFSWSPPTGLDDPDAQSPNTTISQNTTYYVTIRSVLDNGDTCVQFDSVRIQILNTLQINAGDSVKVCEDSVRLSIPLSPGQTVIWSTSNTFSPVIGTTADITLLQTAAVRQYYVKVNAGGCEAIDSIVVIYNDTVPRIDLVGSILQCSGDVSLLATVDPAERIYWSLSPDFSVILANGPAYQTIQTVKTVKYYIRADFRTCTTVDSVQVTVQDTLPVITLEDTLEFCTNSSVSITASVRNFSSIIWSDSPAFSPVIATGRNLFIPNPLPEQTYYIKAFYRDCERTDSIVVRYQDTVPAASVILGPVDFCTDSVFAEATASNYTDLAWSTERDFREVISTDLSLSILQTVPEQTYYFRSRFGFCEALDSVTLYQHGISYGAENAGLCAGDPVSVDLDVRSGSSYSITWSLPDTVIVTTDVDSFGFFPEASQWIRFDIQNQYGCSASDSLYIAVNPLPFVDAIAIQDSIYPGETVELVATESQVYTYQWYPADQVSNPSIYDPTAQPAQSTLYWVSVTDTNGCRASDSVFVKVLSYRCEPGSVFLPTAFSPNGDGVNDLFRVRSEVLAEYKLVIYDRWGIQVFESGADQAGWDGQFAGEPAPADVYAYYFEGVCLQGEQIIIKGNITLFR